MQVITEWLMPPVINSTGVNRGYCASEFAHPLFLYGSLHHGLIRAVTEVPQQLNVRRLAAETPPGLQAVHQGSWSIRTPALTPSRRLPVIPGVTGMCGVPEPRKYDPKATLDQVIRGPHIPPSCRH